MLYVPRANSAILWWYGANTQFGSSPGFCINSLIYHEGSQEPLGFKILLFFYDMLLFSTHHKESTEPGVWASSALEMMATLFTVLLLALPIFLCLLLCHVLALIEPSVDMRDLEDPGKSVSQGNPGTLLQGVVREFRAIAPAALEAS